MQGRGQQDTTDALERCDGDGRLVGHACFVIVAHSTVLLTERPSYIPLIL